MEDLARELAVVADEADDTIDFHVVNQLLERSQDKTRQVAALSSFRQDIDKIIKKIDSMTEELMMVKEERVHVQEQQPIVSVSVGSTTLLLVTKILWSDLMNSCFKAWTSLLEMNLISRSSQSSEKVWLHGFDWSKKNQELIVPGPISLLWNLQTLVLRHYDVTLLPEISEMPKLRHLNIHGMLLDVLEGTILENLSTLVVEGFSCSSEVVKRIPNLKKLCVTQRYSGDYSLAQLNKLESLSLHYVNLDLEDIGFPSSLKKLSLHYCRFPWRKMTIIGSSLPNFEVLKLEDAFRGPEWNPIEGEFLRLKNIVH
ncbi:UNVERIFIED_CONTAM: hypothetical protein Sradi_0034900 [Sesamum radiatum]|uniref:Rx N-terminal domain-containing protein n=1 Tax=Sesamum radiatum TaxID=300843 RepID=A0AAW2WHV8_SESRA